MTSIGLAREGNRMGRSVYTSRFGIHHSNRHSIPSTHNGQFGSSIHDRISEYQGSVQRLNTHHVFPSLHYCHRVFPMSNSGTDICPETIDDIQCTRYESVPYDPIDISGIIHHLFTLHMSIPCILFFSLSVD